MDARPINNSYDRKPLFIISPGLQASEAKVGSGIISITTAILVFFTALLV
jgi:hypothetical protein